MSIELPFPPPNLNPNRRPHWAAKARAFKRYKSDCHYTLLKHREELRGRTSFSLEFAPPDRHRRDADNLLAAFKAGIDALAIVTGVDDSQFQFTIKMGEPRLNGAVLLG